jgi:Leucine-rich repeat (LRR) protein
MVSMPPDHFEPLGQLAQLEHLDLISCRFDEPGQIRHLASLSQLESLDLSGTNVDDGSLRHLIDLPNLNELDLGGTDVTNGAITHLAKMKHLRELRLAGTFDDQDVARLQAALPACQLVRPQNPMGPVSAKAVAP